MQSLKCDYCADVIYGWSLSRAVHRFHVVEVGLVMGEHLVAHVTYVFLHESISGVDRHVVLQELLS